MTIDGARSGKRANMGFNHALRRRRRNAAPTRTRNGRYPRAKGTWAAGSRPSHRGVVDEGIVLRSLHCETRHAKNRRGRKGRVSPVGMTRPEAPCFRRTRLWFVRWRFSHVKKTACRAPGEREAPRARNALGMALWRSGAHEKGQKLRGGCHSALAGRLGKDCYLHDNMAVKFGRDFAYTQASREDPYC
jgi:hypothetical protein